MAHQPGKGHLSSRKGVEVRGSNSPLSYVSDENTATCEPARFIVVCAHDQVPKAHRKSAKAAASSPRYDAPGDEPLSISSSLILDQPFRLNRDLLLRLRRREVNTKEAFTIRDASGAYFRASLKECNERGGVALPYERMQRSPEPLIEITLACAVLARQRMHFVMQKAT